MGTAFDGEELADAEELCSSLRKIIRNIHTELAEKDQIIEEQRDLICDLQSDVHGLKKTAAKWHKRTTAVPVNKSEQTLEAAAKKITMMNHFYIADPEAFLKTPLTKTWADKSRFDSQQNQLEGLVQELDTLLLDNLKEQRDQLADRWAAVFAQAQQDERHSMTHWICTSNRIVLFGSEIATQLEARHRPMSQLLQKHLSFDTDSGTYERVPPILQANPEEPSSKSNMLNSPVVKKVSHSSDANGPSELGKDQDLDVSLNAKCNGKIWGVTSVTPGIIAFAAALICYALSPDNEFGPTGQTSGIPYLKDFESYKMCLVVGRRKKVKAIMELFDDFNHTLFPHHKAKWWDHRDSTSSSRAEDDRLFQEIANAESGEESEGEDIIVPEPLPKVGPGFQVSLAPSAGGDNMTMGSSDRHDEGETGQEVGGAQVLARHQPPAKGNLLKSAMHYKAHPTFPTLHSILVHRPVASFLDARTVDRQLYDMFQQAAAALGKAEYAMQEAITSARPPASLCFLFVHLLIND
ncbi:hypothetical protein M407DRAFT_28543 [Tulasnella calospora MUT 4182]|uniref:Uncharacterized protein n=1 Tax=Tulasnella calospora MUT 4182 TaxID=1051891 RepID=A0A0C3QBV7_9AGAM|nr:hypothetical protein M407DRAFT_28543 [Tulasnella calospora MUT 4182]